MSNDPAGTEQQAVSNFNIANVLTTLRIVMVPFFGWALLQDGGNDATWRWIAFAIFAVAMITDKIDGDLARKHDLVTDFGKIADPIADKAIMGAALICLSSLGGFAARRRAIGDLCHLRNLWMHSTCDV